MHRPLRTSLVLLTIPVALAMSGLVATGASANPGTHDRRGSTSSPRADGGDTPSLIDQLSTAAHHRHRRATGSGVETVVTGLRNPRGLDFSSDSGLFVAEAGEAGGVCFSGMTTEEGGPMCAGLSARISRIVNPWGAASRRSVVEGLVSVGGPLFAIGATGVAVHERRVVGLMGANNVEVPPASACGGTQECQNIIAAFTSQAGRILRARYGTAEWRQNVGRYNFEWVAANKTTVGAGDPAYQPGWSQNPEFTPGDANPYAMADFGRGNLVVDGGSNTLTWVPNRGEPRTLVAFPDPTPPKKNATDAVPTCVVPTPSGIVVADLNGRVFIVDGTSLTVAPAYLTARDGANLVGAGGCAADGRGNVYITDILAGGVVKLNPRTKTLSQVRPAGTLNFPSGIAVGRDGSLFVSNNSVCPSFPTPASTDPAQPNPCAGVTGSIVRIRKYH